MVYKNFLMKNHAVLLYSRKNFHKENFRSPPHYKPQRIIKFKKLTMFAMMVSLLFQLTIRAAEISEQEMLNILRQNDQNSGVVGYEFSFLLTKRAIRHDPNQGMVIMDCKVSLTSEESFSMKTVNYYEKETPVFAHPGTAGYSNWDYDHDGNLIVWRILESYILFTPNRNERIQNIKVYRVDPNGQLAREGNIKKMLHRYPIGNRGNTYEFDQFLLSTGRGYSSELNSITSVKTLPSGLIRVTANRSSDKGFGGTWELTVDPNTDYLVRKGVFTRTGADKPTRVVTSDGLIVKDGLKISKYGTYKYSVLPEVSFEVTEISKIIGPNELYNEVLSFMNSPLPTGTSIVDLRGEEPVRTTVE